MEFTSKIFIDGGDPAETREADAMLKSRVSRSGRADDESRV